jgi:hypothetical protein
MYFPDSQAGKPVDSRTNRILRCISTISAHSTALCKPTANASTNSYTYLLVHPGEFGSGLAGDVAESSWAAVGSPPLPSTAMTMPTTDCSGSTEPAWLEWLLSPPDTIFIAGGRDGSYMGKLQNLSSHRFKLIGNAT